MLPYGGLMLAGGSHNGRDNDFALAWYDSSGRLASDFGAGGRVVTDLGETDEAVSALALEPGGQLVVAGTRFDGVAHDVALARYLVNTPPTLANPVPDQAFTGPGLHSFAIAADTFADADGHFLRYRATLLDGAPLPDWLAFDSYTRTFQGNPGSSAQPSYVLSVTAEDPFGATASAAFTLTLSDVNEAPTDIGSHTLPAFRVPEHNEYDSYVNRLKGFDPDPGETFSFSLVSGEGSEDNHLFAVVTIGPSTSLRTRHVFDYEERSSYRIRLRVTDAGGLWFEKPFTIPVKDRNESPSIAPVEGQVVLNGRASRPIPITLSDPDLDRHLLKLSATSFGSYLLPPEAIALSGSGTDWTLTLTPPPGRTGTARLWLQVEDAGGSRASASFEVTVNDEVRMPFADDFDTRDAALLGGGWAERSGDFALRAGQAVALSRSPNVAILPGISAPDVAVEATVDLSGQTAGHGGLVARYQGKGDRDMYVALLVKGRGGSTVSIWRNLAGTWTKLSEGRAGGDAGVLRFETVGILLKAFFNGKLVTYAYDKALAGYGHIGLRGSAAARFDDLRAEYVRRAAPPLPFVDDFAQAEWEQLSRAWVERPGNFVVRDGAARAIDPVNLATLYGVFERDVAVQADVRLAATGRQHAALVARNGGQGDMNHYLGLLLAAEGTYTASIWVNWYGRYTKLAEAAVTTGTGTLRFEAVGESLRLFLDGRLVASARGSAITRPGTVGIRATAGAVIEGFRAERVTLAPVALPFADSFPADDGSPPARAWVEQVGSFLVQDGRLVGSAEPLNLTTLHGVSERNVAVQADVNLAATGRHHAALVARYSGPRDQNLYLGLLLAAEGKYTASLWRNYGGRYTQLAESAVATGAGTLRFEAAGSSLQLFLNDTLAVSTVDRTITAPGSVGFRGTAGVGFDGFSAAVLPPDAEAQTFRDDFTQADGTPPSRAWVVGPGSFQAQGGQLRTGTASLNVARVANAYLADVAVEATVALEATAEARNAGLFARAEWPMDYNLYWVGLQGANGQYAVGLWRNNLGSWRLLERVAVSESSGLLRFELVGRSLKVYYRGELAIDYVDDSRDAILTVGVVGLRGYRNATFDDFRLETL